MSCLRWKKEGRGSLHHFKRRAVANLSKREEIYTTQRKCPTRQNYTQILIVLYFDDNIADITVVAAVVAALAVVAPAVIAVVVDLAVVASAVIASAVIASAVSNVVNMGLKKSFTKYLAGF